MLKKEKYSWSAAEIALHGIDLARALIHYYDWNKKGWNRDERLEKRKQIESLLQAILKVDPGNKEITNQLAIFLHNIGSLREAGEFYEDLLQGEKDLQITPEMIDRVMRFAPKMYVTESEPFSLMDCVTIIHPERPIIGYHLFWEDDWDFPEDFEPSDHEVIWVEYNPNTEQATRMTTFFHRHMLSCDVSDKSIEVSVQWGKHGSIVPGYADIMLDLKNDQGEEFQLTVKDYLRNDYELALRGGRLADHPLKQDWPREFTGDFADYLNFPKLVDVRDYVSKTNRIHLSAWSNATLLMRALRYNVHAKYDWPDNEAVIL